MKWVSQWMVPRAVPGSDQTNLPPTEPTTTSSRAPPTISKVEHLSPLVHRKPRIRRVTRHWGKGGTNAGSVGRSRSSMCALLSLTSLGPRLALRSTLPSLWPQVRLHHTIVGGFDLIDSDDVLTLLSVTCLCVSPYSGYSYDPLGAPWMPFPPSPTRFSVTPSIRGTRGGAPGPRLWAFIG